MGMRHLLCLPLAVGCAVTQPKRLVIPEEMRRPLATGPSVAEATATPGVIYTQPRTTTKNPFSDTVGIATDDLTKPKVLPAPAAGSPIEKRQRSFPSPPDESNQPVQGRRSDQRVDEVLPQALFLEKCMGKNRQEPQDHDGTDSDSRFEHGEADSTLSARRCY